MWTATAINSASRRIPAVSGTFVIESQPGQGEAWIAPTGATASSRSIALDENGGLYLAGSTPTTTATNFEAASPSSAKVTLPLTQSANAQGYLIKYDSTSGVPSWGIDASAAAADATMGNVVYDPISTAVYVSGHSTADVTLGKYAAYTSGQPPALVNSVVLTKDSTGGVAFVGKYAADGTLRWKARITGVAAAATGRSPVGVAVDGEGNVLIAVHANGGDLVTLYPIKGQQQVLVREANAVRNIVVFKLNPDGVFLWYVQIAAAGGSRSLFKNQCITADTNTNDVYVAFETTTDCSVFDTDGKRAMQVPAATNSAVLLQLNSHGAPMWQARVDAPTTAVDVTCGTGGFVAIAIAMATDDDTVIRPATGDTQFSVASQGDDYTSVVVFARTGALRWSAQLRSTTPYSLSCTRTSQLLLLGHCVSDSNIFVTDGRGETTFRDPAASSNFYAMFAGSGALLWMRSNPVGSPSTTAGVAKVDDASNIVYTAGLVAGSGAVLPLPKEVDEAAATPVPAISGGSTSDTRACLGRFAVPQCYDLVTPLSMSSPLVVDVVNTSADPVIVSVGVPSGTTVIQDGASGRFAWKDTRWWYTRGNDPGSEPSYPRDYPPPGAFVRVADAFAIEDIPARASPNGQVFVSDLVGAAYGNGTYRVWADYVSANNTDATHYPCNVLLAPHFDRTAYGGVNTTSHSRLYIELPEAVRLVGYKIRAPSTTTNISTAWQLHGADGPSWLGDGNMTWRLLHATSSETGWTPYEERSYPTGTGQGVQASDARRLYRWYRVTITVPDTAALVELGRLVLVAGDNASADVNALGVRVDALETSGGTTTTSISALQTSVATNTTNISALRSSVATNTANITALQTALTALTARVTALETPP